MDAKNVYLLTQLIATLIILTGLGFAIAGIVKKKKIWLVIGVAIALIPTIIGWVRDWLT